MQDEYRKRIAQSGSPADSIPPQLHDLINTLLPGELASYRDAFVFVFLIVVLLFRPNGLLAGRAREETP